LLDVTVTDGVVWSVCLSVCRWLCRSVVYPAKTAEPIEMTLGSGCGLGWAQGTM